MEPIPLNTIMKPSKDSSMRCVNSSLVRNVGFQSCCISKTFERSVASAKHLLKWMLCSIDNILKLALNKNCLVENKTILLEFKTVLP